MHIQVKPNFYALATRMGYDIENGDINENHVLYQQGIEIEDVDFLPGEKFKVNDDEAEVYIVCNGNRYIPICNLEFQSFTEDFDPHEDIINLNSGEYLFHEDGIRIEFINYLSDEVDEDND